MPSQSSPLPQILVVDDQENWREVLSDTLSIDCEVMLASTFEEAESLLQTRNFDVLVLDIRLVDPDATDEQGMFLLERLRNRGDYITEAVVVTGYPTPETAKRSLVELQAANYFQKANFKFTEFRHEILKAAERALARRSERSLEQYSILVVEDDPAWQQVLTDVLQQDGYQVETALDSPSAVKNLQNGRYRLAVIDLKLSPSEQHSEIAGMELLDYISSQQPMVDAIVVTGVPSVQRIREAFKQYKVYDFFSKQEFDIESFRRAVEEVFNRISERYIIAWLDNHRVDEPLRVGQEYRLMVAIQHGRSLIYDSAPFLVVPSGRTDLLKMTLFAEDMDIQPSRTQTIELPTVERPQPVLFRLIPRTPGSKTASLDLYQENRWLVNLELNALRVVLS